ncbi:hypothetical protein C4D60_Mb08t06820 [Musa balbisiana]|uniref:B box-type domain-containing protein n=1 Tax=Musa balbisiana TaxID=52838 RepID=A0A4S8K1X7_MUSBA|nr:hypothetical protein C4D60_Mb08t06820 [Musa balbisiana]
MGVKQCELCDRPARMHCESDQASLCWECDAKVHGANFLVARHSRCLLCQSCQSPTPWRAEGARPGYAVSTCERCAAGSATEGRKDGGADGGPGGVGVAGEDEGEVGGEEADEDEDEEPEDDGVDEEGENQVVPWSMTPPPVSSSSSSEEEQEARRRERIGDFLKRTRENVDLPLSQEDVACSSSQPSYMTSDGATSRDRKRPNLLHDTSTSTSAVGDVRFHGNQGGPSSSPPGEFTPLIVLITEAIRKLTQKESRVLGIAEQSKKQQG